MRHLEFRIQLTQDRHTISGDPISMLIAVQLRYIVITLDSESH